jgi:hypothetical protein
MLELFIKVIREHKNNGFYSDKLISVMIKCLHFIPKFYLNCTFATLLRKNMKSILGIIAGIIGGLAIWFLGWMVFNSLFPYPSDIDLSDKNSLQAFYDSLPNKAYITLIITNVFSIFTAGLIATIIAKSGRFQSGIIAVLPFLTYFIVSDFKFDYPTFFVVADISLVSVFALISILFGGNRAFS